MPADHKRQRFALVETWIAAKILADPDLRAGGLAVYVALLAHADDDGLSEVSYDQLVSFAGYGERQVIRRVQALESAGFVRVKRSRVERLHRVNQYQLLIPSSGPEDLPLSNRLDRLFGNR